MTQFRGMKSFDNFNKMDMVFSSFEIKTLGGHSKDFAGSNHLDGLVDVFFFFFFFFMNWNTERAQCALSRVCIP